MHPYAHSVDLQLCFVRAAPVVMERHLIATDAPHAIAVITDRVADAHDDLLGD